MGTLSIGTNKLEVKVKHLKPTLFVHRYRDVKEISTVQASLQKRKSLFYQHQNSFCCLKVGLFKLNFGHFLSEEEKVWLVDEIRTFLKATNYQ